MRIILIEFFITTTRFIIFCETWVDCKWDVERKYEKCKYEKNEYEKDEYEKNVVDADAADVDAADVDAADVDVVDADDTDADDVDDVDADSTIIENEEKKKRARKRARDLIDREKDWEVRILLIHWSENVC